MMDLLERYLAAVRRNLPRKDAHDITAELRDLLLARAEEEEARTGDVDWAKLLQDFGHPIAVAARYRKQRWLIGPELYPFYVHFLKIVLGVVLVVVTAIAAVKAVVWVGQPALAIAGYIGSLWWAAAWTVGSITIAFVVIERFAGGSAVKSRDWSPTELPDVRDRQPSVYESAFEVGAGFLFLLWWIGAIPTPALAGSGFRLEAAPVWDDLFWPVAALIAGRLVYSLTRWLRPRWTAVRTVLGAATAVGGLVIAALAYGAGRWITVVPTGMSEADAAALQASLDLALSIGIAAIIIVWVLGLAGELWRLTREAHA